MVYYNITTNTEFTDNMYHDTSWFSEYQRVRPVNPGSPPTPAFNTSIVPSTDYPSGPTSTPASTGETLTRVQLLLQHPRHRLLRPVESRRIASVARTTTDRPAQAQNLVNALVVTAINSLPLHSSFYPLTSNS